MPPPTSIGEHGVIGDLRTLALVGANAGIEWMCWPRFDSPSIFGRLLDEDGGSWTIAPTADGAEEHRLYSPGTNVLITRFHLDNGLVEIEDVLDVTSGRQMLIRVVTCVRGRVEMLSSMSLRPDYGRSVASFTARADGFTAHVADAELAVTASVDLIVAEGDLRSAFVLDEGQTAWFCLGDEVDAEPVDLVEDNAAHWRAWSEKSTYRGRWREVVQRSALALKLLTHEETGGLIAAGTTSLPEAVDGERNWDYRYVWIRDAAFTLYAFLELGYTTEAASFADWLGARLADCGQRNDDENGPLAPLYDLDGSRELEESVLDHWSGYRQSSPVRIGNAAADQLQLDIYGELIDAMYLADKHGPGLSLASWEQLRSLIDWVCANWDRPDEGMWEVRSGRQRFTSSAVMCWVALERGVRMARHRGRPADLDRWLDARDDIHAAILDRGWSDELGAFTQTFDGDTLDASILLMPLVKFISGTDPLWLQTLDAVVADLTHGVLVDRYRNDASDDGLEGDDGSFGICSFWLVEALTRAGRVDEARIMFEKMLSYAGPLGLFSEVIAPNGRQLGNYPQAFTHLSLISAAIHLDEALAAGGRE